MDPAGLGIDEPAEALGVRRAQLLDLPVLEDLLDDRMGTPELLEHRGVRREAGAGAPAARKLELLEEEGLELLR